MWIMRTVDSGTPVSSSNVIGQSMKKLGGTAPKTKDDSTDPVSKRNELAKCSAVEELDVNHGTEMSPGSSPSSVHTKVSNHGLPSCRDEVGFKASSFILFAKKDISVIILNIL